MKEIGYSFFTSHKWDIDNPECVIPLISDDYYPFKTLTKESSLVRRGTLFQKCPAHIDFIKNVFVFCAPFDLTIDIEVNRETGEGKIFCENLSQEIFNEIVDFRFLFKSGDSPYPTIGIDWLCAFTALESTMIQVFPAFMHYNDFTNKTTVIPGEYDISKWTRPIELVFEVRSCKEKIIIKKGDAISYIKFLTKEPIKLIKQEVPWKEIKICNDIRQSDTFRPLSERYESLEKIRSQQKCPYESKNK